MARKAERAAERHPNDRDEWRDEHTRDRSGRGMRGAVGYGRADTDDNAALGRPDYGLHGGYGRDANALRNPRCGAYGGRGEAAFGGYRGSSDVRDRQAKDYGPTATG